MKTRHTSLIATATGVVLLIICAIAEATSAARSVRFQHLMREDGLSQAYVYDIAQDRNGFMWFATQDGLNRYDGYEFEIYRRDPADTASPSGHAFKALLVDSAGDLWAGSESGGLSRYDSEKNAFTNFLHDSKDALSIPGNSVRSLCEDTQGRLWVGTDGHGIAYRDRETGIFHSNAGVLKALDGADVWSIHEDRRGFLWIGTRTGLYRVNLDTHQLMRYANDPTDDSSLSDSHVREIFEDDQGTIWVGTEHGGLNRYEARTNAFHHYRHEPDNSQSLSDNQVTGIYQDVQGILWVATFNGLNAYDRDADSFTSYHNESQNPYSLSHNVVMSIFQDEGGVLWVGTYRGVNRWSTATGNMLHYSSAAYPELPNDMITSFAEDAIPGKIWIGTFGGGLVSLDEATGEVSTSVLPDDYDQRVMALQVDRRGDLWVGSRSGGVLRIKDAIADPKISRYTSGGGAGTLSADGITAILEDSFGEIWIATFGGGLNRYDAKSDTFVHYRHDPRLRNTVSSDRILAIYEDSHGVLWVGTQDAGLNQFERQSGAFRQVRLSTAPQVSEEYITVITEDDDGGLWVGTNGLGLFRWDMVHREMGTMQFTQLTERSGLPSRKIYSAVSVAPDQLWVGTNDGLARIDVRTSHISSFGFSDGLQSEEFNHAASLKSSSGNLFFGGVNGFNVFDPASVNVNLHRPRTIITDIVNTNRPVNFAEELGGGVLTLTHSDYFVLFRFAGLDYTAPEENRYRYRLEGLDKDWIDAGPRREVTYTNLDPGSYVFRVGSANSSGLWNEQDGALQVQVLAPPWATWWAYSGYGLVALALVYLLFNSQYQKVRSATALVRSNQSLEQEIRIRQSREKELRLERDRIAQYLQVAEVVLIELNPEGQVQLINASGLLLLQQVESQVVGRHLEAFMPEESRDSFRLGIQKAWYSESSTEDYVEYPIVAADGSEHAILWHAGTLAKTDDDTGRLLLSGMDVTELRSLERRVREKEKMAVMGTLAGGIAHDFNNILTAVYGYSVLSLKKVDDAEVRRNIQQVLSATERAKNLIARLLTFARGKEQFLEPMDIGKVAREVGDLLTGTVTTDVRIDVSVEDDMEPVMADETQIHQILMNLGTNALRAVKDRPGLIDLQVGMQTLQTDELPRMSDLIPGPHVVVTVKDNGIGMDQETIDRAFDPFFTLNETGDSAEGSGLGLSVAYSIVAKHQGHIEVSSERSVGTTFRIYLPCCDEPIREAVQTKALSEIPAANVVLVDDDLVVGEAGMLMLEDLGHNVVFFSEPAIAIEYLREHHGDVDIVVTDQTMPGIKGSELVEQIRIFAQQMPVIIASGNLSGLEKKENLWLIAKPYSLAGIQNLVVEVLSGTARARRGESNLVAFPAAQIT